MPLVRVDMIKGKSAQYKAEVLECIHAGLVEAIAVITHKLAEELGVSPTDIFIVIQESPLENWGMAGQQRE